VTTQTEQTAGIAALPRVNLMPPEIAEAERFRRVQLAMGGAVLIAAVAVGALYMHAKSGISGAQSELNAAKAQSTTLQGKISSLASVSSTFAQVTNEKTLLQTAMGQQIDWSYMLNDLSLRLPSNIWLTGMQASESTPGIGISTTSTAAALPGAATTAIGSITFSGSGMKHDDVATWLDALAKEKGFTQPSFASSDEVTIGGVGVVDWVTSVAIDTRALSNKFIQKTGS
jgi:Tfp pilus assembly protein PilN